MYFIISFLKYVVQAYVYAREDKVLDPIIEFEYGQTWWSKCAYNFQTVR